MATNLTSILNSMNDNIQHLTTVLDAKGMLSKEEGMDQRPARVGEGGIKENMKVQEEEKIQKRVKEET